FHPKQSPELQAAFFAEMVGYLAPGDFHPVVDIECEGDIGCERVQQSLKLCLDHLEHRYGVKPIIYTNADYYKNYIKEPFNDYPLWVAHYGPLDKPTVMRNWHFWQHSERGYVNGIHDKVDFNVFQGSMDELRQYCIKP
ncbi:MAG: glycoside hydrolase family 25 protein, partial [Chitinophagaceae bacterium]|nr:glycoside hydrolase family 25 protein [Chitinophagaceae bacterium]